MDFDDFNTPVTLFGWLCNDLKISGCRIPRLSALFPSDLKVPMSDNKSMITMHIRLLWLKIAYLMRRIVHI